MAKRKSFGEYFAKRKIIDDPIGDFATDFRRDPLPNVKSWEDLKDTLTRRGNWHPDVLAAAKGAWDEYASQALK